MHINKQIDVIDVENDADIERLLEKYAKSTKGIDKKYCKPVMQGSDMLIKFGKCIEMSTDTWAEHLLTAYLETVPKSISTAKKRIDEQVKQIEDNQLKLINKQDQLKEVNLHQEKLKENIKQLENAQSSDDLNKELSIELQQRISITTDEKVFQLEKEMSSSQSQIIYIETEIENIDKEIQELNLSINLLTSEIEKYKKKIKDLEQGETIEVLKNKAYRPEKTLYYGTLKRGRLRNAFIEIKPLEIDDFETYQQKKVNDYIGKLGFLILIDKKFRLVPEDESMRKSFLESGEGGQYRAFVNGSDVKYKAKRVHPSGTKMAYKFVANFKGDGSYPWVKISHKIPNIDLNAGTISNLIGKIALLEEERNKKLLSLNGDNEMEILPGKMQKKQKLEEELQKLNEEIVSKKNEVAKLKEGMALKEIEAMFKQQQEALENNTKQKMEYENETKETEKQINTNQKELKIAQQDLQENLLKKRNLAIIIYVQLETAKVLRDFAEMAIGSGKDPAIEKSIEDREFSERKIRKYRGEMIESCLNFINIYDTRIEEAIKECKKDLHQKNKRKVV